MQINCKFYSLLCKTGLAIAYQTCKQKQMQKYQETLKGLSHEKDFKNFDQNLKNLT